MNQTNKPVHHVRLGTIKAAIWANDLLDGGTYYTVTVQRFYSDDGEWKYTQSFRRGIAITHRRPDFFKLRRRVLLYDLSRLASLWRTHMAQ